MNPIASQVHQGLLSQSLHECVLRVGTAHGSVVSRHMFERIRRLFQFDYENDRAFLRTHTHTPLYHFKVWVEQALCRQLLLPFSPCALPRTYKTAVKPLKNIRRTTSVCLERRSEENDRGVCEEIYAPGIYFFAHSLSFFLTSNRNNRFICSYVDGFASVEISRASPAATGIETGHVVFKQCCVRKSILIRGAMNLLTVFFRLGGKKGASALHTPNFREVAHCIHKACSNDSAFACGFLQNLSGSVSRI
jgi:hypothetical protein